jgi:hypothetical protein
MTAFSLAIPAMLNVCHGTERTSSPFRRGLLSRVLRQSWAPCKITGLIRLESPKSVAKVTNLAPVLPLMTETNSELQSLLSQ